MKYFLFDIGNVLVNFDPHIFMNEVSRASGRMVDHLSECDMGMLDEVEKGLISDAEYVEYLNQSHGLSWTVDELIAVWSKMFSINVTGHGLFLNAMKSGVQVYTLSNIAQHHIDAIESNWNGFFDGATGLFLSYQMGVRKPDPSIYSQVLSDLDAEGVQCFFIDDRIENVEAAQSVGIQAHQFVPENHAAIQLAATEFFGSL